ncbi:MAG: gliding motility-associated C-terminal domain-containing protein [Flavobacteriia bacterium]|jgi:gliding motility-associated-like protein|uniref:T9SS type B sorting domain-containing protein n=1 Tax=Flavobacterium sp. TaxID=239 RepID=UPI002976F119|nr:MAG: gliding motility-associated C-terminal domain-containing protein [Flavobacteriia bacterium]
MLRIFFVIIFFNFTQLGFTQLSNKHWIPPLHSRDANVVNDHYIYLSTPSPTPFQVNITSGNGIPLNGSPFTISQGNPQQIFIGNGQNSLMFRPLDDVNIIRNNFGLILEGNKDFYVSFRVRSTNHAEMLVSKGKSGTGTNFRVGSLPQNSEGAARNFVASIMATEDNTIVAVSDYDTDVVFASSTGNITSDTQNFVLNSGESVILSGYTDTPANLTGFIGANITSDKPIAVNTGNALAGMMSAFDGQDFNLDQIVPVEKVGNEYVVVKGNGSDNTERPLVIATEDNTNIYINDSTIPITNLNAGDYYLAPTSFYQGTNNQNMYIKSDKPVYLYQIIAGDISDATSGLNFIPPLSCYWQKSVDLIPSINSIGFTQYTGEIIAVTHSGSIVLVNNVPTSALPQAVLGNNEWVTYRISNTVGDVKIESDGPLAVGVFGASGFAGYGGYYSGFGSIPEDTNVSICSNESIDLFDAIIGNPLPNGTWTPSLSSGNGIFNGAIDPPGNYDYSFNITCGGINIPVTVTVTVAVFQAVSAGDNASVTKCINDTPFHLFPLLGSSAQTGGSWSPNLNSGTDEFNPAIDLPGIYKYTLPAIGVCPPVTSEISVTINPIPNVFPISALEECDNTIDGNDANGFTTFNLSSKDAEIIGSQTGIAVSYHLDPIEASFGQNSITTIYTNDRIIYVRLTNITTGCFTITSFNLNVRPVPIINNNILLKQCDIDTDARTTFNLTQANLLISTDTSLTYTYHNSLAGADNNTDLVFDAVSFNAYNGDEVWVRITNSNGCFKTSKVILIVSATIIPQTYRYTINDVCDDYINATDPDGDGIGYFNLTEIEPALTNLFPSGQSYTFTYYLNQTDAETEQNFITNITNFRNTVANNQLIWVRIESNLYDCAGLGPFLELIVNPLPDINLGDDFVICIDPVSGLGSRRINATPTTTGNYSYAWIPTNPSGNVSSFNVTAAGTYEVTVTNLDTSCTFTDSVNITLSSEPASIIAELITPAFSSDLASIQATAIGGFGIYEYSLNGLDWQSSPIFNNLSNGSYNIYVRDNKGCGLLLSNTIQTITYINYFTPNGDGYNDSWNIYLPIEYEAVITIYDRYGKLLKQISPETSGWDGIFNGELMPSTDYWFKVEYTEDNTRKEFKSHFSLKR